MPNNPDFNATGSDTIAEWTFEQLIRVIQQILEETPPSRIPSLTCDELFNNSKTVFSDQVQFTQVQTTVGAAGGATALPATPRGYFKVLDHTGQTRVVPFYDAI